MGVSSRSCVGVEGCRDKNTKSRYPARSTGQKEAILIEAILGDITTMEVDVVVNAANESLEGGGGVDGAIHRAAGPELKAACAKKGPCATGSVKLTAGFDLPARFIIHAVGPVWRGGEHGEAELLASCYRRAMQVASSVKAKSIAFPAISTGIFGFPAAQAAQIAVNTLRRLNTQIHMYLVAFDQATLAHYQDALDGNAQRVTTNADGTPLQCNVCGQLGAAIGGSTIAPMSDAKCQTCVDQGAESEGLFEDVIKYWESWVLGGLVEMADFRRARTFADGRYVTWAEWLALRGIVEPK